MEYMKTTQIIRCRDCKLGVPKAKRDQLLWECRAHGGLESVRQPNSFCSFAQPRYPECTIVISCAWCKHYQEVNYRLGLCGTHGHTVHVDDFCSDAVLADEFQRKRALGLVEPWEAENSEEANPFADSKSAETPIKRHIFRFWKSKKGNNTHETD